MRITRRVQLHSAAGFGLLGLWLFGVGWLSRPSPPSALVPRGSLPHPGTPSATALRAAKQWQLRANVDAFNQLETRETWDPKAATEDAWRPQLTELLAVDRCGWYSQARASA